MRLLKARRKVALPQLARRENLRIGADLLPITLKLNPRARKLIVKVHPSTGEVTVVAPSQRALRRAMDFARSEFDWIRKRLARVPKPLAFTLGTRIPLRGEMHIIAPRESGRAPVSIDTSGNEPVIRVSGDPKHAPRRVLDFLKREARKTLEARAIEHAAKLGMRPSRITVRDTASRWGSCSTKRALSFSWRLILAPDFVLDYVVAHEVAHMKEMNHSVRFWKLARELGGDIRRPQLWLSQNGTMLHRYAPRS